MKLKDALEAFLLVDRAESTRRMYSRFLTAFVNSIGPDRALEVVTSADIAGFVNDMRQRKVKYENHEWRPRMQGPLSSTTIYKNVKMIKTFFKWCVDHHYLAESPADFLVNKKPVRPLGQGKACTDEELEKMLDIVRHKPRDRAILMLIAYSGCRAGEAAGLQIQDLDLGDTSAYVNGKGDMRRRIYFGEDTSEALAEWLAIRPAAAHDYVFTSVRDDHAPLSAWAISNVIRRISKDAGLKRTLGAHSLRHRVGLTFARGRVAPRVAQFYLGHTNIQTTLEYYQDVDESDLRRAGQLLGPEASDWQEEAKQNPAAKLLKPRTGSDG